MAPARILPRQPEHHASRRARQVAGRSRQQRPVNDAELRPRDLSTQDLELVAQDQHLDVFHVQAAPATNKRAQHGPNGEINKGDAVASILPAFAVRSGDTDSGALQLLNAFTSSTCWRGL